METYVECPTCHRNSKREGRDMALYQCRNCGYIGCCNPSGLSSRGCYTSVRCPRCDESNSSKMIGWLA